MFVHLCPERNNFGWTNSSTSSTIQCLVSTFTVHVLFPVGAACHTKLYRSISTFSVLRACFLEFLVVTLNLATFYFVICCRILFLKIGCRFQFIFIGITIFFRDSLFSVFFIVLKDGFW